MNLPIEFVRTIEGVFGDAGRQFIADLPTLVDEASQNWGLTEIQPSSNLSYNFVAFAKRGEDASTTGRQSRPSAPSARTSQREVVLKMGVPHDEMKSEINALRLYNGQGACRLFDWDEEKCWLLLERLQPGVMLSTWEDDEQATHIAADVMQKIWRPMASPDTEARSSLPGMESRSSLLDTGLPDLQNFIQLTDWFDGLNKLRPRFDGGTGPLNGKLVERVEGSVKDFFAENQKPVLMHGDFHHFNILSSERGWLVIDPKGVIGPAGYEVGPFLINPWGDLVSGKDYRGKTRRRIDILHERLGFERKRIREWGLAHAVLSAWWSIEGNEDWRYAADFAEMIADLPLNL